MESRLQSQRQFQAVECQPRRDRHHGIVEAIHERACAPNRLFDVEMEAIDLSDAGVGFEMVILDFKRDPGRPDSQIEQPLRRTRANDDSNIGPTGEQRIDDFDVAGSMSEAVARNIEDEGSQRRFFTVVLDDGSSRWFLARVRPDGS